MLGITACSEKEEIRKSDPENGLPIMASIDTRAIPANLTCSLYVFWKNTGVTEEYTLKEIHELNVIPYDLKFLEQDLEDKDFRFFFIAQPTAAPGMDVLKADGTGFAINNNWTDMVVRARDQVIDENFYYGIIDKDGPTLCSEGEIHATLIRIVGQIVLDIYRIGNNISDPKALQNSQILSVLDRVFQIDVEYHNLTKDISFDASGNVIEKTNWATPVTQTITVAQDNTFRVALPQLAKGLALSGAKINDAPINGTVRVKGTCGLASTGKVKAKYTFKYYDTTPKCGDITTTHTHDASCYDNKRTVEINMPKELSDPGLDILPNTFTVNKAGIRMDRIIDLNQPGSFGLDTVWENQR